ncbi:hypothetical protein FRC09_020197 [Ceratobasidium sp. 395]|nr:hypothetical protein FRC09_020197 [Ceratobasidium sp. 395]
MGLVANAGGSKLEPPVIEPDDFDAIDPDDPDAMDPDDADATELVHYPTRQLREEQMSSLLNRNLLHRLRVVGHHIHTLSIGLSVLPVDWNVSLHQLQVPVGIIHKYQSPFLPKLRNLFFGRGRGPRGDNEWLDITWQPNNICDLFLLFLCPSLEAVSFVVNCLEIDPEVLYARAPSLTDMRLGIFSTSRDTSFHDDNRDERPTGAVLQENLTDWSARMLHRLPSWKQLTALTVNGFFLAMVDALLVVSRLPQLSYLCVISVSGDSWGELPSIAEEPFPALKHLALERTNPRSAVALIQLTFWAQRISRLTWTIKRGDSDESRMQCIRALVAMSEATPGVRDLWVDDVSKPWNSLWGDALAGEALSRFGLRRFSSGLGQQLVSLTAINFVIPLQLIVQLANAYPNLEELRCTIDVFKYCNSELVGHYSGWVPKAHGSQHTPRVCLIIKVDHQMLKPAPRRELWKPDIVAWSVWPNVIIYGDAELPTDDASLAYLRRMQRWLSADGTGDTGARLAAAGLLDKPVGNHQEDVSTHSGSARSSASADNDLALHSDDLLWLSDDQGEENEGSAKSGSTHSSEHSHSSFDDDE